MKTWICLSGVVQGGGSERFQDTLLAHDVTAHAELCQLQWKPRLTLHRSGAHCGKKRASTWRFDPHKARVAWRPLPSCEKWLELHCWQLPPQQRCSLDLVRDVARILLRSRGSLNM